ncbi:MAG: hypothetical protein PHE50_02695 [Dehalococcoidales bacterium]|nr:hypothetical protein [Dehalococcoidales bacterium]
MARIFKKKKQSVKIRNSNYPIPTREQITIGKPIFSLIYLQKSYCISICSNEQKIGFTNTMRILSSMTWNQINSSDRHLHGKEIISRKSLKVPVPSFISEDENIIAIRFHDNAPMVGVRRDDIFHIFWFDRNFTVYNHDT